MYNKIEIEKNLRLLEDVVKRDFPRVYQENARTSIIRAGILADFALESLSLSKEDVFLKEVKEKIKDYISESQKVLAGYEKNFKPAYVSL
jgi:hypothetical protein